MTDSQTETQTLRIERVFDCSPDELWAAWTDPDQFAKWINPFPGADAEVHEMAVEPGGHCRFTMYGPDGTAFPEEDGTYEVVESPSQLIMVQDNEDRDDIFADHPMRMDARIETAGDQTKLVFVHSGYPEAFPMDEAEGGFGACFDKLEAVLAGDGADTNDREMVLSRTIAAPRELVFAAWTDADAIGEWWGPDGFTTTTEHFDFTTGGTWEFVMHGPDGTDYPNFVRFLEIEEPVRIVHDHGSHADEPAEFRSTITFEETDGKTTVTMRARFSTKEAHDEAMDYGAVEGGQQTLARLAAYLKDQ